MERSSKCSMLRKRTSSSNYRRVSMSARCSWMIKLWKVSIAQKWEIESKGQSQGWRNFSLKFLTLIFVCRDTSVPSDRVWPYLLPDACSSELIKHHFKEQGRARQWCVPIIGADSISLSTQRERRDRIPAFTRLRCWRSTEATEADPTEQFKTPAKY